MALAVIKDSQTPAYTNDTDLFWHDLNQYMNAGVITNPGSNASSSLITSF